MPAATNLVVGWDHHPSSVAALRFAADLAHRLSAHLHVVHVIDLEDLPLDPDAADWAAGLDEALRAEAADAAARLDELHASWTYHTERGNASHVLADIAERHSALLIVVGAPRGGFGSLIGTALGESVAHRLVGNHRIPVLVVPTADPG